MNSGGASLSSPSMEANTRLAAGWRLRHAPAIATALAVIVSTVLALILAKLGTVQRDLKAILIVVAVIVMVIAALRPRMGLVMFLVLMPFEFHFSGTGTDEVLMVAMAAVLAWRIEWRAIPVWISIGGAALVLGSFASVPGAHDQALSLWGAVRWLSALLIMFAAFSILRRDNRASRRMVDIFTASAVIVVLFAFAQKVGINLIVGAPYIAGLPDSFFSYYTNYAGYAAIAAIMASGELLACLAERRHTRGATYGVALLVILSGVAISVSRGGLLALGSGWLILLVLNFRRGKTIVQAIAILAIFVGGAYLVTPSSTISRIERRFSAPLGSLSEDKERFDIQEAGKTALRRYPFGLGYGNFTFYARANVRRSNIHEKFTHAQNTPVQIGLDAGWLGLLGFLMLVVGSIVRPLIRKKGGASAVRATACAAALGGFMAQGLFDYLFYELAFVAFVVTLVWGTFSALSSDGDVNESASVPVAGD